MHDIWRDDSLTTISNGFWNLDIKSDSIVVINHYNKRLVCLDRVHLGVSRNLNIYLCHDGFRETKTTV